MDATKVNYFTAETKERPKKLTGMGEVCPETAMTSICAQVHGINKTINILHYAHLLSTQSFPFPYRSDCSFGACDNSQKP